MAFEMVLAPADDAAAVRRRMTLAAALAVHGALATAAVLHAGWSVDELRPPTIVTQPVPAPRAEAGGGGGPAPRAEPAVTVCPRPRPVPRAQPKPTPAQTVVEPSTALAVTGPETGNPTGGGTDGRGTGDGRGDGNGNGKGGLDGSDHGDDEQVRPLVPPTVASQRCLSCPKPHLPAAYHRMGTSHALLAKVCADAAGNIASVKVLRGIDATADTAITAALRAWRFQPVTIDGRAVPFCSVFRFVFSTE